MKKLVILFLISLSFNVDSAQTATTAPAPTLTPAKKPGVKQTPVKVDHPCAKIARACKFAGYSKKGPKGRYIKRDCLDPITRGKQVRGVTTITPEMAKECKAKKGLWYISH